jgi:RHS repeat-associated protein
VTRSGTTTVGRYDYSAFGRRVGASGSDVCRFQFSSKERDPSTGWSYYGYRYYAPHWQRWPNRDPIGEAGGINLYAFVANNPVNRIDPLGLSACDDWKKSKDLIDCLRCCTEQFSRKACIPSLRGPGYMARYHACRSACMMTDGEQGPNLPQPGKPKDPTENPNPKIPDISIPHPPKK